MGQNLATLLSEVEPCTLNRLRERFPESSALFSVARELGEDTPVGGGSDVRHREAIVEFLVAGVDTERRQFDPLICAVRERMKLVAKIKLAGAIIATSAGAVSAVFAYAGSGQELAAMVSALIAMCGGLSSILADHFERAPSGLKIASAEEYGKLVEMRSVLEQMNARLARDKLFRIDDEELQAMSKSIDTFAGEIVRLALA